MIDSRLVAGRVVAEGAGTGRTGYTVRRLTVRVAGLPDVNVDCAIREADGGQAARVGTIVFFGGSDGTFYWDAGQNPGTPGADFLYRLTAENWQVIQPKWGTAWDDAPVGERWGIARLAARNAAVVKYLRDTYAQAGTYIVSGNSGGASVAAWMVTHYGLVGMMDAVIPTSGPPHAVLRKGGSRNAGDEDYWYEASAANNIDGSYGYPTDGTGPTATGDESVLGSQWARDSHVEGARAFRSDSRFRIVISDGINFGRNGSAVTTADQTSAQQHGLDLGDLYGERGIDHSMSIVPGMEHEIRGSRMGLQALEAAILDRPHPRLEAYATATSATSATATFPYSRTPLAGSLLVACVFSDLAIANWGSTPAGWTEVFRDNCGGTHAMAIYTRQADGTETGFTTPVMNANTRVRTQLFEVPPVHGVNPAILDSDNTDAAAVTSIQGNLVVANKPSWALSFVGIAEETAVFASTWNGGFEIRYQENGDMTSGTRTVNANTSVQTQESWDVASNARMYTILVG